MKKVYCIECKWYRENVFTYYQKCVHPKNIEIIDTPAKQKFILKMPLDSRNRSNDCHDFEMKLLHRLFYCMLSFFSK
jgi:hypothetical protein